MAVPEEIRRVPRPKNTVVCLNGNGINKYVVRQRAGAICIPGRNPMPLNGIVVGHIIDMYSIDKHAIQDTETAFINPEHIADTSFTGDNRLPA